MKSYKTLKLRSHNILFYTKEIKSYVWGLKQALGKLEELSL